MKNVKTKQRFSLSALALTAMLVVSGLASCSKGETELPPDGLRAISLSANVQATTETRAAVVDRTFPANTTNVFRLTAFTGMTVPVAWSVTPYFDDIQVNSGASSALTLATAQYYPANGDKVFFYGYAPEATSLTAGTSSIAPIANYTITGQQDIMAAQVVTGIAATTTGTQSQPNLAFTHKLMQVRFKIVKDVSFEASKKVTEILVKGVKNSAKLNISTGTLTFDGTADQDLSLPITAGTNDEITSGGTEMDGCIMLEPVGTGSSITLKVTADGVTYDDISVALSGDNNGKAGTSHLIALTFKRTGITPTAAITDWTAPVDQDTDIDGGGWRLPVIGDFINGGIVYWVDGANYKVVSLEETQKKWAPADSYAVSAAQSDTDGRANSKAIRAYFEANTATVGSDFDVAFPAASYCYNYTGKDGTDTKGTWYLPAKNELQHLWCAFNGKAPIDWGYGLDNSAPTDADAQKIFNAYLTTASGVAISNKYFWSSTENSDETSCAKYVYFLVGYTSYSSKTSYSSNSSYVRCVRKITPPPAVGDYYFTDGSFSSKVESGKTVNGVIYWVDGANYKVVSLEETLKWWAAFSSYAVSAAQSDIDGKANSNAIRDYFEANTTTVGTDFDVAFPAASYCYNYTGKDGTDPKGTWYLPAKSELQHLWCAYNGKAPINWAGPGTNASAPADATAQDTFNRYLTTASGVAISNNYFWSSTEDSSDASYAWCVNFSGGATGINGKSGYRSVRCVRDI